MNLNLYRCDSFTTALSAFHFRFQAVLKKYPIKMLFLTSLKVKSLPIFEKR